MKRFLFFTVALFSLLSCNVSVDTDSLVMKREHMFSDGPFYTFPMSVLEISCEDCGKRDCVKEKVVCCAKDIFGYLNIRIFSEDAFNNQLFKLYSMGEPIVVSPEIFDLFSRGVVKPDKELLEVYSQQGIGGILNILSSKDLALWEKDDYERFKYIVFLCWQHDIFFTEHMNDEYPIISWSISGNKKMIDKYYKNE